MEAWSGVFGGMGLKTLLLLAIFGLAVGAMLLSFAYRLVVGCMPSYLRAMAVLSLTAIGSTVMAVLLALLLGGGGRLVGLFVQYLLGAALVNALLTSRTGVSIGFGKACLVQLVFVLIEIAIGVLLALLIATLFGASTAGVHG